MRFNKLTAAFLASFLSLSSLHAEEEEHVYTYWEIHPWHVGGQFLRVGKADCRRNQGHMYYRKTQAFTQILLPINYDNFFIPRIEYNNVSFDWSRNPNFNQKNFNVLQSSLAFYTTALDEWKWIARFDYNLQLDHMKHPGKYSLYNGLLWGALKIHRKWHYHVGGLGYVGLEGGTFYPIIGADFAPNKHWFFQALFPINYSAEYKKERWTFAFKIRPVKERLRSGPNEPVPKSVFSYAAYGSEINVSYDIPLRLNAEIYGGVNYGGKFYVKDGHGHNATYVNFGAAPYFGAALDFGF